MYEFSPHIWENIAFLEKLASVKTGKEKNELISKATTEQILALVEICENILKSHFKLKEEEIYKLEKYANFYRDIAKSKTEKTARRKIQKGSGIALGAILIPVLSVLAQHLLEKFTS